MADSPFLFRCESAFAALATRRVADATLLQGISPLNGIDPDDPPRQRT
jgi:hypothetical protein